MDVFAQVCEEVISSVLDQLQRLAAETDDGDKKKECRIKMRAIEAYGEELSSRLLQHVSSDFFCSPSSIILFFLLFSFLFFVGGEE